MTLLPVPCQCIARLLPCWRGGWRRRDGFLVDRQGPKGYLKRMPWQGRIDASGALRHIAIRGIERRGAFENEQDREGLKAGMAWMGVVSAKEL
jgi:hypothetical protein